MEKLWSITKSIDIHDKKIEYIQFNSVLNDE